MSRIDRILGEGQPVIRDKEGIIIRKKRPSEILKEQQDRIEHQNRIIDDLIVQIGILRSSVDALRLEVSQRNQLVQPYNPWVPNAGSGTSNPNITYRTTYTDERLNQGNTFTVDNLNNASSNNEVSFNCQNIGFLTGCMSYSMDTLNTENKELNRVEYV